jgi:secreted PhoX family phosphatase
MTALYDGADFTEPVLNGVDNIIVSSAHDLYVAEDGGNLEVCVITPELDVFPVVRLTGDQHGSPNPTPLPTVSEVSGLAMSPDGDRLYFNSQRGQATLPIPGPGPGITYEITGPFRGGSLANTPPASPPTTEPPPRTDGALPATGAAPATTAAAVLGAAGAAALALRRRSS